MWVTSSQYGVRPYGIMQVPVFRVSFWWGLFLAFGWSLLRSFLMCCCWMSLGRFLLIRKMTCPSRIVAEEFFLSLYSIIISAITIFYCWGDIMFLIGL